MGIVGLGSNIVGAVYGIDFVHDISFNICVEKQEILKKIIH